jgi:copper homeostasis protein
MTKPLIELCVEGIDGFLAAQEAGADRVELCASLMEGGLTPSLATIRAAVKAARIPVHVIVRPRGGDFLYSQAEFETMLEDVRALKQEGVSGVVIGCLTPDGRIDEKRTRALVEAARPMSVTCHRAFDMTADANEALEALIRCGIDRVLTSGQRDTAVEGLDILRKTNERAAGRIVIMGCGALDATNIAAVRDGARLVEMHFAALKTVPSGMAFRNAHVGMGGTEKDREYELTLTDPDAVRATIAAAKS